MLEYNYDYNDIVFHDNIIFSDYTDELNSKDFNSLTLEQQNNILKKTVIALSSDFEKLISIIIGIQVNLRDATQLLDQDILEVNNRLDYINDKVRKHVDSVHARLIIGNGKEK